MPMYRQGDNQPPLKTNSTGIDLSDMIANCRVTAQFEGKIIAGATDADLTLKLDSATISKLRDEQISVSNPLRAIIKRTGEWVEITGISGSNATVTRGGNDQAGTPTTPAPVEPEYKIFITPLDEVPVSAELDTDLADNTGAILTLDPEHTKIPAEEYSLRATFQDDPTTPTKRFTHVFGESLLISHDENQYGV